GGRAAPEDDRQQRSARSIRRAGRDREGGAVPRLRRQQLRHRHRAVRGRRAGASVGCQGRGRSEEDSPMSASTNRQVRLKRRPVGEPKPDDFELAEAPIPHPGDGQVLSRTIYLSLDPYMRGRMNEARSYAPSVELGQVMVGGTVSEVVESR